MRRLPIGERRAELIDAAIRVIARDGLAAASTRAIVAEAGMPLGAFHYAFDSRDDLLAAVIDRVTDDERIAAWLVADDESADQSIDAVLARGLDAFISLLETDPERELALLEVALHTMRHDPAAARRQWATYRVAVVESLRYAAQITGVTWTVPLDELARWVQTWLDGITVAWLTDRDGVAARRATARLAATVAGLAAPAAPTASDRAEEAHHAH